MGATMLPEGREIRRSILRASHASGHGHIPTSFSIIELICAAYAEMRHDPARPDGEDRDIFILSKGHGALGYYGVLAHLGYLPVDELSTFGAFGSRLGCHPDRKKVPGVEVSTGSLGHGIAVAVGMALAFRIAKSPRRVFTVVGDGEANEGSVWESVMVAAHLGLNNLSILLDFNRSQGRSLPIENPAERFAAFGCDTIEVDGHDLQAIREALSKPCRGPRAVIAHTVKGYGCSTLTGNVFEWHRKSPSPDQLALLMAELESA